MINFPLILNEREAGRTRAYLSKLNDAISNSNISNPDRYMLASEVRELHVRALSESKRIVERMLISYSNIKDGNFSEIAQSLKSEPGLILIVARIARGLSQGELAEKLGVKEQQIQRYEAERYRTINLESWRKFAVALGVSIEAQILDNPSNFIASLSQPQKTDLNSKQIKAIVTYAREHDLFPIEESEQGNRLSIEKYISGSLFANASSGLLRTGMKSIDLSNDAYLAVWRARVLQLAEKRKSELVENFDQSDIGWLSELVKLSANNEGPLKAIELLSLKGVVTVVEPQVQGLKLDGGAFLLGRVPVIGLTLRHDRIDNFWYTLFHELAHVFLHYNAGLDVGFLDDEENTESLDELEQEADAFASMILVHPEKWRQSSVRITKSASQVESFARQLEIHPAIIAGKIRRERNDYRIFLDLVGSGSVRTQFLNRRSN